MILVILICALIQSCSATSVLHSVGITNGTNIQNYLVLKDKPEPEYSIYWNLTNMGGIDTYCGFGTHCGISFQNVTFVLDVIDYEPQGMFFAYEAKSTLECGSSDEGGPFDFCQWLAVPYSVCPTGLKRNCTSVIPIYEFDVVKITKSRLCGIYTQFNFGIFSQGHYTLCDGDTVDDGFMFASVLYGGLNGFYGLNYSKYLRAFVAKSNVPRDSRGFEHSASMDGFSVQKFWEPETSEVPTPDIISFSITYMPAYYTSIVSRDTIIKGENQLMLNVSNEGTLLIYDCLDSGCNTVNIKFDGFVSNSIKVKSSCYNTTCITDSVITTCESPSCKKKVKVSGAHIIAFNVFMFFLILIS